MTVQPIEADETDRPLKLSAAARAPDTPFRRAVRRFRRHTLGMIGMTLMVALILAAALAPVIGRYPPNRVDLLSTNAPPSAKHWFGTDRTGRDIWARTIYAGRVSLSVGLVAVMISTTIGVVLGALSGYYGKVIDFAIMRLTDIVMSFPIIVIALTIVALLPQELFKYSIVVVMAAIGLLTWPGVARLARAQILSLRERDFVTAARCLGVPEGRIIFRHVLPNALAPILVSMSFAMANAILLEAGLSFFNLGVQPPTPSWGNMLEPARNLQVLEGYPWQWVPPGVMIVISVLSINFIGDALRDALDPRMQVD
ncbi:MAG: oligopeptide ABC transporter permease [Anaerolineae bacterium]